MRVAILIITACSTPSLRTRGVRDLSRSRPSARQGGAPADSEYPSADLPIVPNSCSSGMGLAIGRSGAKNPFYSPSNLDVWNVDTKTITASDPCLSGEISYAGTAPTFGCDITDQGTKCTCNGSADITTDFVGSSNTQKGQVQFPC